MTPRCLLHMQPYLLVDVREPEEYDACHVTEAINMPARVLSRDSIAPEIYRYVRGAHIVVSLGLFRIQLDFKVESVGPPTRHLRKSARHLHAACAPHLQQRLLLRTVVTVSIFDSEMVRIRL